MVREILFKAKRIDNGEWVEGFFVNCADYCDKDAGRIADIVEIDTDRMYVGEYNCHHSHKVDINTLCQYTGLTDKNGNKIWENDIVQYKQAFRFEYDNMEDASDIEERADFVKFKNGKFYPIPYCSGCEDPWYSEGAFDFEVFGNIFDNPELSEG